MRAADNTLPHQYSSERDGRPDARTEVLYVRFRTKADNFDLADVGLRGTQVPIYSQVQMKQSGTLSKTKR